MAAHNRLGKEGEDAVAAYLERKGYTILHRNWRKNRLELDIVATHDGELVVVEVKTRTNTDYKEPQEAVDWRKVRHIVVAADAYIKHFAFNDQENHRGDREGQYGAQTCPSASTSSRPLATSLRS